MPDSANTQKILHASSVALDGAAVLIMGPSGSGKSGLALELMSRGFQLIADDRTVVTDTGQMIRASCPPSLVGQIEARSVGILAADPCGSGTVRLVVDLGHTEQDRLPQFRDYQLFRYRVPLLHGCVHSYFPAAITQYLKGGRIA